ncbi:hypothetical protein ABBQ38_013047 [Trebouxia sp. C0009 RCD-2024]
MGLTINTSVAAIHASRLRVHHVQPRLCQQSNANLGVQFRFSLSGRQDRSCFACCTVPADAPERHVEPAQQVRYRGVRLTGQKTVGSSIAVQGERYHMGTYTTPEEAACVYDEACILLKKEPVNFPKSQYDEATILQIPDFETFVKQKKATGKPKAKTSRYIGVSRNRLGQWVCQANLKGQRKSTQVQMGAFPTEEMAARAYDKLRIYQGLDTSNFPIASYKLRPILKHKTIDSLVASSKAEARALKRTEYSSRYKGVHKLQQVASFPYAAAIRAMNGYDINLGRYETEEQAAMSYDQSCIYQVYWSELEPETQQVGSICICRSSTEQEDMHRVF